MTFDIRRARPDEYDAVGALTVAAYQADDFVPAGSGYDAVLADAASRAEKAELWVAVDSAGLLGSVTFCPPRSPYREIGRDGEGEFRMLGVAPAARGRGVGLALTRHCLARARELGFGRLVLCSADEMAAAHRLYARLGFTRIPERDWQPVPGHQLLAFTVDL